MGFGLATMRFCPKDALEGEFYLLWQVGFLDLLSNFAVGFFEYSGGDLVALLPK
jgi:hypothetical protein